MINLYLKAIGYDMGNYLIRKIGTNIDLVSADGVLTKKISDWIDINGSIGPSWAFSADFSGFKRIVSGVGTLSNKGALNTSVLYKYNNVKLNYSGSGSVVNTFIDYATGQIALCVSDSDTGFQESWTNLTSFTGMNFEGLIRTFLNGWKLTTSDVDVSNCIWTGIKSGTTKTGSDGYEYVKLSLDIGFTPYKIAYTLAIEETITLNKYINFSNNLRQSSYPIDPLLV